MHAPSRRSAAATAAAALGAALVVALAAPVARAGEADAPVVVAPRGLAEGDADAALADLLGVVERDPGSAEAEAAILAGWGLWSEVRDPAPAVARLEAVLAKGIPHGDVDEAVRRSLAERYRERGDEAKRDAVGFHHGYLRRFLVAGPFGIQSHAEIRRAFPPETEPVDLDREMPSLFRPVRWHVLPALESTADWVDPFDVLHPTVGVAYAICQVKVAAETTAALRFTSPGTASLTVNGRPTLTVDRLHDRLPRTVVGAATLRAGWNRIVVKVVGSQGFALKLCDPATGHPLRGFEEEEGRVLHPAVEPGPRPGAVAYRPHVEAAGDREPSTPAALVVRAILRDRAGLDWAAYDDYTAAVERGPRDPGVLHRAASFIEGFSQLPDPRLRKNRARALYEDLLEVAPGHVPAVVALARMLNAEDRTEEALAGLRELPAAAAESGPAAGGGDATAAATRAAMERSRRLFPGLDALLAERPDFAAGWIVRADFCDDRKWRKESDEAAAKAAAANPRSVLALRWLLRAAERDGNTALVESLQRRILAVDAGSFGTRRALAEVLLRRGQVDEALALFASIARDHPRDFDARKRHAAILADRRRYDEAIALVAELERPAPLDAEYPRLRAGWLRLKGDEAGARAAYDRALALAPDASVVRRAVERMDGVDEDFARPHEEDAVALWRGCGDHTAYPKAVAVHLLDLQVVRVNDDGSWTSITHNAWKILNEQGREKYSHIQVPGELLEVRAVSPDGEVHMPIGALGRGSFTMEGLQAGWLLEYRYRADSGADPRGFNGGRWYFQDPNFGGVGPDPVLISRLVVDLPESLPVRFMSRNQDEPPTTRTEGGRTVHVFERRNMDRIEQEPRMPPADEICPWVEFYVSWTFEELASEARDYVQGIRPTPILERKAAELVRGVDGSLARARAIYAFVNEHVSGTSSGAGGPTGVLLEASGDRFGLFAALCMAAGLRVDPVRVCTDPNRIAIFEALEPSAFGTRGVVIEFGTDAEAWIFGFSRHTPFGLLPEVVRGKPALVASAEGGRLVRAPWGREDELVERHSLRLVLGATAADTTFQATVHNPTAAGYGFKESLKDMNEDDRRKTAERIVTGLLPTPGLGGYAFPDLAVHGKPLVMTASGDAKLAVREEGGATVLSLGPPPMRMADAYVGKADREWPFVIRGTDRRDHEVVVDLSGSWRVKRLPRGHLAASRLGTYSLTVEETGGTVRVRRIVNFGEARYQPDEYRAFIAWCRDIDTAEEQRIVVERVAR